VFDREGGGELGGESGVISTERVGENDKGAKSRAHPAGFTVVEGIECDAIECGDDLSLVAGFITIGLLRFISVAVNSSFTLGGSGRADSCGLLC